MKNLYKVLLMFAVGGFLFTACKTEKPTVSTITTLDKYTVVTSPLTNLGQIMEVDTNYTVIVKFDDKQITNINLLVQASPSSEATEGMDFVINTKEIEVGALSRDSIEIGISILADYVVEKNEKIMLTLVGKYGDPRPLDVEVGTIVDDGLSISPSIDITLRWKFDNPKVLALLDATDVCNVVEDLDITVQTPGAEDASGTPMHTRMNYWVVVLRQVIVLKWLRLM